MAKKLKKGFAAMDPKRLKELASLGGKTSQALGTAHRWNSEEAKAAVQKREENKRHEE